VSAALSGWHDGIDHRRAQLTPDYMKKLDVHFNGGKAFIPGADYSGVVHAAGKNSKWTVGQGVHGMNLDMAGKI
jgi:NADPH:quinone reductase-like Zn-dependent oxidoreductase